MILAARGVVVTLDLQMRDADSANLVSSHCVGYTLLLACAEIELALNWLGLIDPGMDTRRLARSAWGFPPVQAAHRSVPTSLIPPNLGALGLNGSLTVVAVVPAFL